MKTSPSLPFPAVARKLRAFGQRLRAARLRREISTIQFCERINVSRDTLHRMEKGDWSIAIGTYMRALRVLGLDEDLDTLAADDVLGRKLQDLQLPARKTRGVRKTVSTAAIDDGSGGSDGTSG
jgi:transcriptional regulator with XRE-family HTH domain